MKILSKGTAATRDFYNEIGWRNQNGILADTSLFGWSSGPIHQAIEAKRQARILKAIEGAGGLIAELGCGGTPAIFLARQSTEYTAVDFSSAGLLEAEKSLAAVQVPLKIVEADITDLPFQDNTYDVVYSAHAIYHIDTVEGQEAAFREALRVVRPGGIAIFILANPFPLLFPFRAVRRVLAVTPGLNTLLNKVRKKPPLPYLPMPLRRMKQQLESWGDVKISCHAIPSVQFDRSSGESTLIGRMLWRGISWLESSFASQATWLGCYVLIVVRKSK